MQQVNSHYKKEYEIGISADLIFLFAVACLAAVASLFTKLVISSILSTLLVSYVIFLLVVKNPPPKLLYVPGYSRLLIVGSIGVFVAIAINYIIPTIPIIRSIICSGLFYLLACTAAYNRMIWTPRFGKIKQEKSPAIYFCLLTVLVVGSVYAIVITCVFGIDYLTFANKYLPHRYLRIDLPW